MYPINKTAAQMLLNSILKHGIDNYMMNRQECILIAGIFLSLNTTESKYYAKVFLEKAYEFYILEGGDVSGEGSYYN